MHYHSLLKAAPYYYLFVLHASITSNTQFAEALYPVTCAANHTKASKPDEASTHLVSLLSARARA